MTGDQGPPSRDPRVGQDRQPAQGDRSTHGDQSSPGRDARAGTSTPGDSKAEDSHAEQVLSQALRLMAGGGAADRGRTADQGPGDANRQGGRGGSGRSGTEADQDSPSRAGRRFTTGQLLLVAAIVGLLIGITAGLLTLL